MHHSFEIKYKPQLCIFKKKTFSSVRLGGWTDQSMNNVQPKHRAISDFSPFALQL